MVLVISKEGFLIRTELECSDTSSSNDIITNRDTAIRKMSPSFPSKLWIYQYQR